MALASLDDNHDLRKKKIVFQWSHEKMRNYKSFRKLNSVLLPMQNEGHIDYNNLNFAQLSLIPEKMNCMNFENVLNSYPAA